MRSLLKRIAARLPRAWQQELKRLYFARQVRRRTFVTNEVEYGMLPQFVSAGDWALDIGANVGHYTARLSELVGPGGRIIAFEPVPDAFALLAANVARLPHQNVTLLNVAASDTARVEGMDIPRFDTGLDNFYMAKLVKGEAALGVLCVTIDGLGLDHPVRLVKIDAEGHEVWVLKGMCRLLERDRPILIIEDNSREITTLLDGLGYESERLVGSSNRIFRPRTDPRTP